MSLYSTDILGCVYQETQSRSSKAEEENIVTGQIVNILDFSDPETKIKNIM